ncbi:MAG: YraN family protein [Gammaproteobacteria bacterium]|nr:YraN family protein [Gammaproteobacteria bacterium]
MTQLPRAIGDQAENQALQYLEQQGLKLITRNFQIRRGEIDLIMQHADELVFIEVRTRSNTAYGDGVESINRSKRLRLVAAASAYLQRQRYDMPARFDVVSIDGQGQINWIADAFRADD